MFYALNMSGGADIELIIEIKREKGGKLPSARPNSAEKKLPRPCAPL